MAGYDILTGADPETGALPEPTKTWVEQVADAAVAAGVAVASGLSWTGSVDLTDLAAGDTFLHATLTGNTTLVLPTPPSGRAFTVTLRLQQDATGSRTLTLPGGVLRPYGVAPVLSTAANAVDVVHLMWSGTEWMVFVGGMAMA